MGFQIRIRTAFVVALLAMGLTPLAAFTWYSYERGIAREFDEVKDRHLLLANNLSAALSRYEKNVRATVHSVAHSLQNSGSYSGSKESLRALRIRHILLVDPVNGAITSSLSQKESQSTPIIGPALINTAAHSSVNDRLKFSEVNRSSRGNYIYLTGRSDMHIVIAEIGTGYFAELGDQIAFGQKGGAAIVDQKGNVLSHPLPSWVAVAKNISELSPVQRMMNEETGIEQFYSPELKGDVIAGLTSVAGPGWGVMIHQPVSELYAKVIKNLAPILAGLFIATLLALSFVYLTIRWLAKPLEKFTLDLQNQSKKGMPTVVPPSRSSTKVQELQNIFNAYNDLALIVQHNAREMTDRVFINSVTGIGNRSYFDKSAKEQIEKRVIVDKRGVLIFIDLDGFKEVNDIRGHAIGDALLKKFAEHLYPATKRIMDNEFRGVPGAHPIIGRIGGDEFAILLPIPDNLHDVSGLCEKLRQSFPTTVEIDGTVIPCGASAGGAVYPDQGDTVEELIPRADVALYMAKANGKGKFELYNKMNVLGGKSEILLAVMHAIENEDLTLEYQPKFCLTTKQVTSVEALLRWIHPTLGKISPGLFLPAIQKTHVMTKLGEWVVDRAASDIKYLDDAGYPLNVAVNIGAEHFSAHNFVSDIVERCTHFGVKPDRFQIEVTEDVLDVSKDAFKNTVGALQEHGFAIAIDDFGKGYSNLSRLASVPVDVIKLDRSLISEAVTTPRIQVIMKSAIDMAHALGSRIVVEGVETLEEVAMAELAGADVLQGYYYSPSLPPEQLIEWMESCNSVPQHKQLEKLKKSLARAA